MLNVNLRKESERSLRLFIAIAIIFLILVQPVAAQAGCPSSADAVRQEVRQVLEKQAKFRELSLDQQAETVEKRTVSTLKAIIENKYLPKDFTGIIEPDNMKSYLASLQTPEELHNAIVDLGMLEMDAEGNALPNDVVLQRANMHMAIAALSEGVKSGALALEAAEARLVVLDAQSQQLPQDVQQDLEQQLEDLNFEINLEQASQNAENRLGMMIMPIEQDDPRFSRLNSILTEVRADIETAKTTPRDERSGIFGQIGFAIERAQAIVDEGAVETGVGVVAETGIGEALGVPTKSKVNFFFGEFNELHSKERADYLAKLVTLYLLSENKQIGKASSETAAFPGEDSPQQLLEDIIAYEKSQGLLEDGEIEVSGTLAGRELSSTYQPLAWRGEETAGLTYVDLHEAVRQGDSERIDAIMRQKRDEGLQQEAEFHNRIAERVQEVKDERSGLSGLLSAFTKKIPLAIIGIKSPPGGGKSFSADQYAADGIVKDKRVIAGQEEIIVIHMDHFRNSGEPVEKILDYPSALEKPIRSLNADETIISNIFLNGLQAQYKSGFSDPKTARSIFPLEEFKKDSVLRNLRLADLMHIFNNIYEDTLQSEQDHPADIVQLYRDEARKLDSSRFSKPVSTVIIEGSYIGQRQIGIDGLVEAINNPNANPMGIQVVGIFVQDPTALAASRSYRERDESHLLENADIAEKFYDRIANNDMDDATTARQDNTYSLREGIEEAVFERTLAEGRLTDIAEMLDSALEEVMSSGSINLIKHLGLEQTIAAELRKEENSGFKDILKQIFAIKQTGIIQTIEEVNELGGNEVKTFILSKLVNPAIQQAESQRDIIENLVPENFEAVRTAASQVVDQIQDPAERAKLREMITRLETSRITKNHGETLVDLLIEFAGPMVQSGHLSVADVNNLIIAAYFHDIGKVTNDVTKEIFDFQVTELIRREIALERWQKGQWENAENPVPLFQVTVAEVVNRIDTIQDKQAALDMLAKLGYHSSSPIIALYRGHLDMTMDTLTGNLPGEIREVINAHHMTQGYGAKPADNSRARLGAILNMFDIYEAARTREPVQNHEGAVDILRGDLNRAIRAESGRDIKISDIANTYAGVINIIEQSKDKGDWITGGFSPKLALPDASRAADELARILGEC